MQPTDDSSFRLLLLAEIDRLNECLREFRAEVRRQEDGLRALYPRIAQMFRGAPRAGSDASDQRVTKH